MPDSSPPNPNDKPTSLDKTGGSVGYAALARGLRVVFRLLIVIMIVAILLFLWKSFFVVEQHEVGLLLRFGRLVGDLPQEQILDTGLHLSFPHPIDEKVRVPLKRTQNVESDTHWYHEEPQLVEDAPVTVPRTLRPGLDGYVLTGDTNILHARWALRYTVHSPITYAFRVYEPGDTFAQTDRLLRLLLDRAVVQAASSLSTDEVWRDKDAFRGLVQEHLDTGIDKLGLGVEARVFLQEVSPPRQVRGAFLDVTQAEADRGRIVNQARAYASDVVTGAQTQSAQVVAAARGYAEEQENAARADADYFRDLLPEYRRNPTIIRQALYEETMQRVLEQVEETFILDGSQREVRLQLERKTRRPGAGQP